MMLSVGFLFLYTRFIWLWLKLGTLLPCAVPCVSLSPVLFVLRKTALSVSFELCVRVCANERDREQALSQAVNAHTHRTHSLLLLFFLFFSLLASLFLVRWRGFVRYVLCDKRPPNPASERERSESKAKHIQLGCLGVFTHTSQTIMSVCSHGDHL